MAERDTGRVLRGKAHLKGVEAGKLVETTNSLNGEAFFAKFFTGTSKSSLTDLSDTKNLKIELKDADSLGELLRDGCFKLIEQSSREDYIHSEVGWKPTSKKKEMLLPDMKYIILSQDLSTTSGDLDSERAGFISFMVTYEDGHEVVYIYEIHLSPRLQGEGLGKLLMSAVEDIGRNVSVEKCMLSVFKSNTRATNWYQRLGYSIDEFSPGPKRFRNGVVKQPQYLILSKGLR